MDIAEYLGKFIMWCARFPAEETTRKMRQPNRRGGGRAMAWLVDFVTQRDWRKRISGRHATGWRVDSPENHGPLCIGPMLV